MPKFRQVLPGIVIACSSLGLLLGVISLSLAEGTKVTTPVQSPSSTLTASASPTRQPTKTPEISPTSSPTLSITPSSTPTNCPVPPNWQTYSVQPGEGLDSLAVRHQISSAELSQANCLPATGFQPGVIIHVPSQPTNTQIPCGQHKYWIIYHVQPGDTLYHISHNYSNPIGVDELQRANCLGTSTHLHVGQMLYIPPWPTITITPTHTETPTPTSTTTREADTPTLTLTPSETATSTMVSP